MKPSLATGIALLLAATPASATSSSPYIRPHRSSPVARMPIRRSQARCPSAVAYNWMSDLTGPKKEISSPLTVRSSHECQPVREPARSRTSPFARAAIPVRSAFRTSHSNASHFYGLLSGALLKLDAANLA